MALLRNRRRSLWRLIMGGTGVLLVLGLAYATAPAATGSTAKTAAKGWYLKPGKAGGLDCNGYSKIQKTILRPLACTDVRGSWVHNRNVWGGRFQDNGHYIGHDEPDMTFYSSKAGSGNSENWVETLPKDPTALPTDAKPGKDVTHWFELSVAPWFGMALCDGTSYPQLPCTPNSDKNAPSCFGPKCPQNSYPGAGSAFLEMQFYPPGDAPFYDSISCDNTHWCASLHINELMCTYNFVNCNANCEETTNFAFVQRNGVPTGPPGPQLANNNSYIPNSETLLMNPGDKLRVKIWDAKAPAVPAYHIPAGHALEVKIWDLTTHQIGWMQASAFNGYAQTNIQDCSGRYYNFEPEYKTAKPQNVVPWAALQMAVSTEYEIGHWTPCNTIDLTHTTTGGGGPTDVVGEYCTASAYETHPELYGGPGAGEDYPCFVMNSNPYGAGDTHGTFNSPPNEVGGCLDSGLGGDIDFDGTSYRANWPVSATINQAKSLWPSSFRQLMPTFDWNGKTFAYSSYLFQTDTALSESNCSRTTGKGCSIPPTGPEVDQSGHTSFFPFWTIVDVHGSCTIEFGNVTSGKGVIDFGRDKQYGTVQDKRLGYPEFMGKTYTNTCKK